MLNYLFKNFYEESELTHKAQMSADELQKLIADRLIPKPSYVLSSQSEVISYFGPHSDQLTYRFHLKAFLPWVQDIRALQLTTECQASEFFFERYSSAAKLFFASEIGLKMVVAMPKLAAEFGPAQSDEPWAHFLDGTYGVCTRTGLPEGIIPKLVCVRFIEFLVSSFGDNQPSTEERKLLARVVDILDGVESDFAPHEIKQSSRWRCIIEVRRRYLNGV